MKQNLGRSAKRNKEIIVVPNFKILILTDRKACKGQGCCSVIEHLPNVEGLRSVLGSVHTHAHTCTHAHTQDRENTENVNTIS